MLHDPKAKIAEIALATKMSTERVFNIIRSILGMNKLRAGWVLRLLAVDQNRIQKLITFQRIPKEFFAPIHNHG